VKIVIDLPEDNYQLAMTKLMLEYRGHPIVVIPDGHGDLIDRDELKIKLPAPIEDEYKTAYSIIDSMPAVINADTWGM